MLKINWTYADDPVPKYTDVTSVLIVSCDELVPSADTKAQESKLQDPGKLKYYESDIAVNVFKLEVPEN